MMLPDNVDLFNKHDAEQREWLMTRPICNCCGDRIQDESYHRINNENICDRCLEDSVVYND